MPLTAPRTDTKTTGAGGGGGPNGGGKKGNNCSFCPALACRSNDFREKVLKCISRHDSTFDLSKLSPGKRLVVTTLRNYHKTHPDATTLNDVDLKVTKAPKGGGGGGAPGNAGSGQPTGALAAIGPLELLDCGARRRFVTEQLPVLVGGGTQEPEPALPVA